MSGEMHIVTLDSELYPPLLREITDPPQQLYLRGNIQLLQQSPLLAVVGSRKATAYGKQVIKKILPPVVAADIVLVSGLAIGIDALAHKICVEAGKPTIAVLGSGIDDFSIYPRAHSALAQQILQRSGCLVSEYPAGTAGYKSNFPARNRIIAGLCQATLLIQAAQKSGSLITARLALESNRDVWAVPGAITDPLSAGTNQLIKDGATPITSADDILFLLGIAPLEATHLAATTLSPDQEMLLKLLSHIPQHIDDIAAASALPTKTIGALLVELELAEQVQNIGGMKYVKK